MAENDEEMCPASGPAKAGLEVRVRQIPPRLLEGRRVSYEGDRLGRKRSLMKSLRSVGFLRDRFEKYAEGRDSRYLSKEKFLRIAHMVLQGVSK